MHKIRLTMAILLALALSITAPALADGLEGSWNCVSYIENGVEYDAANMFSNGCSIEFQGAKAVLRAERFKETVNYYYNGGEVTFSDSLLFQTGRFEGNLLYVDYYGVTLVFSGVGGALPTVPPNPADRQDFVGAWEVTRAALDGVEVDVNDILSGDTMFMYLNEDFSARLVTSDDGVDCYWRQTGADTADLYDDGSTYSLTLKADVIKFEIDNGVILICERAGRQSEAYAYIGTWNMKSVRIDGQEFSIEDGGIELGLLTITENGELTLTAKFFDDADVSTDTGSWTVVDSETASGVLGNTPITLVVDQNKLILTDDEGDDFIFEVYVEADKPNGGGEATGLSIEGRWILDSALYGGISITPAIMGIDLTLIFSVNGTMKAVYSDGTVEGSWSKNADGTFSATYDGATEIFRIENDKLLCDMSNSATYVYVKADADVGEINPVGNWTMFAMEIDGVDYDTIALGVHCDLSIFEDGTIYLVSDDDAAYGNWSVTNPGEGVLFDGSSEYDFTVKDDVLSLISEDGVLKFRLDAQSPAVSGFEGEWRLESIMSGSTRIYADALGISATITINADGSFFADTAGAKSSGDWSYDGSIATLIANDGAKMTAELSSGSLKVTMGDGVERYYVFEN